MSDELKEKLLKEMLQSFVGAEIKEKYKPRPCRIKINGKFVKTLSGKTIWNKPSFAKNAINNHVKSHVNCIFNANKIGIFDPSRKVLEDFILEEVFKRIEIVEI